jgi:uncharacterized cupredoxin-like copper-binding protein
VNTRRIAAPLAAAALLATAAACGTAQAGGAPHTPAAANKLTITTHGMAYTVSGHPRPGHVDITFDNADEAAHEAQIVKLKDGKTIKDVLADMKSGGEEAAAADIAGDPDQQNYGTPALLYGHQRTEVVTDTMQPGTYGIVCFLPGPDGMPHVAMGMAAQFTVAGEKSDATPRTAGTVRLADDGITVPDRFGNGTYAVTNTGTTPHSFSVARLDGSLDQLFAYIGGQFAQNKPIDGGPGSLVAGVTTLAPGQTAYLVVHLRAGHYGYVSTVQGQDPSDTDYARGLHGEFTVR